MHTSVGSKMQWFEPESWWQTGQDVVVGSVVGGYRAAYVMYVWFYVNTVRPLAHLVGVQLPDGKRPKVPGGTLKIAAVGFGRTGTYSVALALEELGFPTLHTVHMYEYENEEIMQMWVDTLVKPAMERGHDVSRVGRADLQLIAQSGYQAVADLPSCLMYEQIWHEFPDCKFILTTRSSSEVWYRSWASLTNSITSTMYLGGMLFPSLERYSNYLRWLYAYLNKDASYMTSTLPKGTNIKENAIASYEEHNANVRRVIPRERLLEFRVEDGWAPLCTFLEIENCPTTPFPKTNAARTMQAQSFTALWGAILVLVYGINYARKRFRDRCSKVKVL